MRKVDISNQIIIGTITDYAHVFFFYITDYYTVRYHYYNNNFDTLGTNADNDSWRSLFPNEQVICK